MPDEKFSALGSMTALTGTEQFVGLQGAGPAKLGTAAQLATYIGAPSYTAGVEDDLPAAGSGKLYLATDRNILFASSSNEWTLAGYGPNKATLGPFSDSNYFNTPAGSAVGPLMSNPYTLAIGFYVSSLPGTSGKMMVTYSEPGGSFGSGFYIAGNTSASNKLRVALKGVNSGGDNLIDVTLTTGAHALAIKYDGSNLKYSYDGAAVQTIATTGTYTAPSGSAVCYFGRWTGTGFGGDWQSLAWVRGFASAVADADLQTLSGSPSTYIPPVVSATVAWDWQARHQIASLVQYIFGTASGNGVYTSMTGAVPKTAR